MVLGKKVLGLVFGAHFLHEFSIKMFCIYSINRVFTLSMDTKFQSHTFFLSQDIKQNVLLSSYLGSWWHHKLEDLSWINHLSNCWQGEKEGKAEMQKFEYLHNEKSFLD